MTGDWRRLALAAWAAAAVAVACVTHTQAQAPAQATAKKDQAKEADAEQPADDAEATAKKPVKKRQDPVEAQRTIEAALKLLEVGKPDQATQALTTVLNGGNLPPAIMAKALLYRGIAYRQQKKPAQAIADLTSALWLKGGLVRPIAVTL
jgi:tetratricopeptide (TPR) repeat protein